MVYAITHLMERQDRVQCHPWLHCEFEARLKYKTVSQNISSPGILLGIKNYDYHTIWNKALYVDSTIWYQNTACPKPRGIMLRMSARLLEFWYGFIYLWLAQAGQHLMQVGKTCDPCGWASLTWARSAGQRVRRLEGSHLWSESRVSKSSVVLCGY